jgi:hypothetical protein
MLHRLSHRLWATILGVSVVGGGAPLAEAQLSGRLLVPGTGTHLTQVGDDFEDPNWGYQFNNPKSSEENDDRQNQPLGRSTNGRWYEGIKRGHPDVIKRVPTPDGGLPGSEGALLLQSLQTGVPGRPSRKAQQDDFICNVQYRLGGTIPVSKSPSVTTRVFLPPVDEWEKRSGPHFAFRAAVETTKMESKGRLFGASQSSENEVYWPGLFIVLESRHQSGQEDDYAYFRIRANQRGADFRGPQITTTGWWTLGMSFTPDGAVHYFASPGVQELTEEDYITSQFPYGYRCERFRTLFYNVINGDDGRTWSTPWVVDDPKVYVVQPIRTATSGNTGNRR